MLKSSTGYEHGWYVVKSSDKPFSHYTDHVTNQVHIPINILTLCLYNQFYYTIFILIQFIEQPLSNQFGKLLERTQPNFQGTNHPKPFSLAQREMTKAFQFVRFFYLAQVVSLNFSNVKKNYQKCKKFCMANKLKGKYIIKQLKSLHSFNANRR